MSAVTNQRLGGSVASAFIIGQTCTSVFVVSSGTVATSGVVTLTTALPGIFSGGAWIHLPASAIVGGSAGLYWCVFSSTTVGQVYTNFVDASATEFTPYTPSGTLVAAVGSNSAYTQSTSAITVININIPSGTLTPNSSMVVNVGFAYNLAAGTKTFVKKIGSTLVSSFARTTTGGHDSLSGRLRVQTSTMQSWYATSEASSTSTTGQTFVTENLNTDIAFKCTAQIDTATNYAGFEALSLLVLPA